MSKPVYEYYDFDRSYTPPPEPRDIITRPCCREQSRWYLTEALKSLAEYDDLTRTACNSFFVDRWYRDQLYQRRSRARIRLWTCWQQAKAWAREGLKLKGEDQ